MNRESDTGNFSLEDIDKVEEKQSYASADGSVTTVDLHSNCGTPGSDKTNTQPVVALYLKSGQEDAEPIHDVSNHSGKQNRSTAGIIEALDEGEVPNLSHREKKLKMSEHSDLSVAFMETSCLTGSSLDQSVEFEATTRCSESMQNMSKTGEDGISVKIAENKIWDKTLIPCSGFLLHSLSSDCEMLNARSNGSTSGNYGTVMLTPTHQAPRMQNDAANNAECAEIHDNTSVGVPQIDGFSTVSPLLVGDKEAPFPATSFVAGEEKKSSDADKHQINIPLEITASCVEEESQNVVGGVTGDFFGVSAGELLGGDSLAPTSEVVDESINLRVTEAFSDCSKKKLLVLDVNGLLVDISPYVPYDYDPDDIINRRAVFKRPYCDSFLEFCFEKFIVGVWSSRTRSNMEPILDLIFGNHKQKLAFRWDQSHCTDSGFTTVGKRDKPLLLKKLKKLWEKREPGLPWEKGEYNETNTLLLDDTPCKSLMNPQYNAIFPRTYRFTDVTRDRSLGPGGDLRVYLEGLAVAENVQEYVKHNAFGQRAITDKNLSWRYYLQVIEASSTPPRQDDEDDLEKFNSITSL